PTKICLPSLKEFHLDSTIPFSNDYSTKRLLCNCPVLEDLDYKFEDENFKFIVSHPTLKSLALDCIGFEGWSGSFEIVINAPSLGYLEYFVRDVNSHTFVYV
ncbi:hypothetical protein SLEP1_g60197, partial [Rubroshorea leprosula]